MKLVALVESTDHVCYRYRFALFEEELRRRGWTINVAPISRTLQSFVQQLALVRSADVVFVQRKLFPAWKRTALRHCAKKLIFDFDDAIFMRDSNSRKNPASFWRRLRFSATVHSADLVLCGNSFLQAQAAQHSRSAPELFPTTVPLHTYPQSNQRSSGRSISDVRLVWIGSSSTAPSLLEIAARLRPDQAPADGPLLRIICDTFPDVAPLRTECHHWSEDQERALLASSNVGVAWLPEHPWSLGKCGLKVLQYMAAGLPVIANPLGVHREMIEHGVNGFLASTREEWLSHVATLSSPEVRARMGAAARLVVEKRYSAQSWAHEFTKRLEHLISVQPGMMAQQNPAEVS